MRALAILLAFVGSLQAASAAEVQYPPGSRIGLVPPTTMRAAQQISGFQDPTTGAAIMTMEMPAEAYSSLSAGFTDEALKLQGFTIKTRETVRIGDSDAILVSGDQDDRGHVVPKAVLLAGEPTLTALVIAQLPREAPPAMLDQIRGVLKTVSIREPLSMEERLAALPFRIGDLAGFRPIRVLAGSSIMLTDGPKDAVGEAEQPILIVAASFAPAPPVDQRDVFARAMLVSNTFIKDAVIERSQSFRQDGAEWQETVAKATDGPSGKPVVVSQTIRFGLGNYLRIVGVVRAEERTDTLPRFRRLADSIKLKD